MRPGHQAVNYGEDRHDCVVIKSMIVFSTARFVLNVAPLMHCRSWGSSAGVAVARSQSVHYSARVNAGGRGPRRHIRGGWRGGESVSGSIEVNNVVLYSKSTDTNDTDKAAQGNTVDQKAWIVLFLLSLTFISNQWCRQIIYYLVDFSPDADAFRHLNIDLNFDKEIYSKISSVAFTAVFALGSLFAGSISEKFNRKNIIVITSVVWSLATAAESTIRDGYFWLVPLRALLGISQSVFNPGKIYHMRINKSSSQALTSQSPLAAYTLLADIFPKNMLGVVNGIFGSGIYLGGSLASLSILLDKSIGWRSTVNVLGALGVAVAVLVFLFAEDTRHSSAASQSSSSLSPTLKSDEQVNEIREAKGSNDVLNSLKEIVSSFSEVLVDGDVRLLYIASALRFCAGFSIGIWKAPFIFLKFPGSEDQFASANALIIGACGLASSLLGGYLSDRLSAPSNDDVKPMSRLWIPAIGSLLAVPLFAGFTLTDQPNVAALLLFFEYLVAECWAGPTLASLFGLVPSTKRGTAQGLFSIVTAIGNLGPIIIGSLSSGATMTAYGLNSLSLQDSFLYVVCLSYLLCGVAFTKAALNDENRIADSFRTKKL